jgi:hypothetical protein
MSIHVRLVTEKEIIDGILSANDANERTLCFLRDIVDIREHLNDEKASKYIDLISDGNGRPATIDDEANQLLDRLKNDRLPAALTSANIFKYNVHWSSNGIDRKMHATYIEQFNNDVYQAVKKQIDQCVQSRALFENDGLHHEVVEHAVQCRAYTSKFHGRADILAQVCTSNRC